MPHSAQENSPLDQFSEPRFRAFTRYVLYFFGKNFSGVRVLNKDNAAVSPGRAVVFFSNHSAWWDAIMMHLLSAKLVADRKPFAPMDQTALEHYRFMARIGLFGVEQESARGAVRFLQVSRALLERTDTSLWMTPQGEFLDPRVRPVNFKPGLAHLARDQNALLIPIALEYPFWEERKPEALINFGRPVDPTDMKQRSTEDWNKLLEQSLADTMDELAATAMQRDPDSFHTLIAGSAGVNPLFDAWQFVKSIVTGKKFSRRHRDVSS